MILQDIKDKLKEVDENTFFGSVKRSIRETLWNYIVFERVKRRINTNKTSYTDIFAVHIVRENWIEDGVIDEVISKMLEIPGMRVSDQDGEYTYVVKPNTDSVVEMFTIEFVKPKKG